MANLKRLYHFYFEGVKIPISSLTIRRRRDSIAFCSATMPDPEPYTDLIAANPNGSMIYYIVDELGVEGLTGAFSLDQVLSNGSANANTVVLNGTADFATDQASTVSGLVVDNPMTTSNDSNGFQRFSADENSLIVIGDTIVLEGIPVVAEEISLFVNASTSRMDLAVI